MSYFRGGDPLDDFARRDRKQSKWLKSRPKCSCCRKPIQEERLLSIDLDVYHIECAIETFGADTEDFM